MWKGKGVRREPGWRKGELGRAEDMGRTSVPSSSRNRQSHTEHRRSSLLPLQWKMTHSSRWKAQVLASELSLVAFLLLLLMVFSKRWLYPSKSRFHQRYPQNITKRVYTSIHSMSTGLLYICIAKSCPSSDNGEGEFLGPIPGLQPALTSVVAPAVSFPPISCLHLACKMTR